MGLIADAKNIQSKDPAARSLFEVMWLYPGFHILVYHRLAHWLYCRRHFLLARMVSQTGRRRTGIEIHPGAQLGPGLFIDHGMGIVIGETAEIGANCTIYHQVTLGGTGKDTGVPARVVRRNGERVVPSDDLNQQDIPDLLGEKLAALERCVTSWNASAKEHMGDADA